ncbi:Putative activity regulator of membrane protease YbbK [hydrothermal vent metagenome]|uniref:Activity regulator of membrane protease YbbK n=1 Tax=hydrothermal vent metagenome TaxID=652676 RepID=A0A3B0YXL9_9ZZZZ
MTLEQLGHWHWWILAAVLIIFEVFAPGAFFLWLGLAAAAVGGTVYLIPGMDWEYQVLIFSVLSVVSIIIWRKFFKQTASDTDQPTLNRRGEQYVGRVFTLEEPIIDGMGKIRVDDSTWKIRGNDCQIGAQVTVTGTNGTLLEVSCKDAENEPG